MAPNRIAFTLPLSDPGRIRVVTEADDHDGFDSPDCSIYSDESGDDGNVIDMIEDEVERGGS